MKRFVSYILLFLLFSGYIATAQGEDIIIDETNLSGTIGPGSYITDHNLFVDYTDCLTVLPGTTIKFISNTSLTVYGCLISIGTESSGIIYKSSATSVKWNGISFPGSKALASDPDDILQSKFKYSHFENVTGPGAIYFSNGNAERTLDSISYCSFTGVVNAIHILFINQAGFVINNCDFSDVSNTGITFGNSPAVSGLQILNNTFSDLSGRFLYVYSNSALESLTVKGNTLDNLVLKKSAIRIENNQYLNALTLESNDYSNFITDVTYPVADGIIYIKGQNILNQFRLDDNTIQTILSSQQLNPPVSSFLYLDHAANAYFKLDNVVSVSSLNDFILVEDCETVRVEDSKFESLECSGALFNLSADKYCRVEDGIFKDISTNDGNGCFYFSQVASMDEILFRNNRFEAVTAENGPCLYVNSPSGSVDSVVFRNNDIFQDRMGYTAINGGVAYLRLSSVSLFRSYDNEIRNCEVTGYGGAYCFDVGTVNNLDIYNDDLHTIISNYDGGYISVKNQITNTDISINGLTADTCFSKAGSGGILYLKSQNNNTGKVRIQNNHLNHFYARSESQQFAGGGFFIRGSHKELHFTGNALIPNPTPDQIPIADDGGVLYYAHTGSVLDSAIFSGNSFIKADSVAITGSGGAVYLTSTGQTGRIRISDNEFDRFSTAGSGGVFWIGFEGQCNRLDILNNEFSGCVADSSGGAIFFRSSGLNVLNVAGQPGENQLFTDCRARFASGGSLYVLTQAQSIGEINFNHNSFNSPGSAQNALSDGGAVYVKSAGSLVSHLNLSENSVNENNMDIRAGGNGGAFYFNLMGNCTEVNLLNNSLSSCLAGRSGGAVYLRTGNIGRLTVEGETASPQVKDCHAANGGAYYFDLSGKCDTLDITSNNFMNCAADTTGGAIYFKSNGIGLLNISAQDGDQQKFNNCQAASGYGGVMYFNSLSQGIGEIGIRNNQILSSLNENNSGKDGGGFYFKSVGSDVANIDIRNNTVGNSNKGLKAGMNGGAFYFDLSGKCNQLSIHQNNFNNCRAVNGSGGSIFFLSGGAGTVSIDTNMLLSSSAIENASANGGGIYIKTNGGNVTQISLNGNEAGDDSFGISSGENGGAFSFDLQGTTTLLAVTGNRFVKCRAQDSGGGLYFKANGLNELKLQGFEDELQHFSGCSAADGSGGAVCITTTSQPVSYAYIEYNTVLPAAGMVNAGENGGGISITSAGNLVEECFVDHNIFGSASGSLKAGNSGGAISVDISGQCNTLRLFENSFTGCQAVNNGGAVSIHAGSLGTLTVSGSPDQYQVFGDCSTENLGGCFYLESDGVGHADFQHLKFENSTAESGGALAFSSPDMDTLSLNTIEFTDNSASDFGGSIYLKGDGNNMPTIDVLEMNKCTFINSEADNGDGGALFFKGNLGLFNCSSNSFNQCEANGANSGSGSAMYLELSDDFTNELVFTSDTVKNCHSVSGGIFLKNIDKATFLEGHLVGNTATQDGAAIYIQDFDTVLITGGLFSQNESQQTGGAILLKAGNSESSCCDIGSSEFEFNKALNGGAVTLLDFNQSSLLNNRFIQNSAFSQSMECSGGAVYTVDIDDLVFDGNEFISNSASTTSTQNNIQSYGGSLCILNNKYFEGSGNDFRFSNAEVGGAVFAKNTDATLNPSVKYDNNFFYNNGSTFGGAVYYDLMNKGGIYATENVFLMNGAGFSGGAIDLRNIGRFESVRNIFRSNFNEGKNLSGVVGASAILTWNVPESNYYNTVFDYNFYEKDTITERESTIWIKNHDNVYFENCTFLNQIPQDNPVIYKDQNSEPLTIVNSIFSKNVTPETPLVNDFAEIRHSYIEGLITEKIDTMNCFRYPPPQFVDGTYNLNDNDFAFIDAGIPEAVYNDSIDYPIGKGTETCDLGVSGGRYNLWDEEQLSIPLANQYSRTIIIERYNGECGRYRIYFALNEGDEFTDYTWYIFDEIHKTGSVNEFIGYFPQDQLIAVTGVASNESEGITVIGNNTFSTFYEITLDGSQISYEGSDYQCGATIELNDNCPVQLNNIVLHLEGLDMPFFSSYKFGWSFRDAIGIASQNITDQSYEEVVFSLDMEADTTSLRSVTVVYNGYDTVCDITFEYECLIRFHYSNLENVLELVEIAPPDMILDPGNVMFDVKLNDPAYYCNGVDFYLIEEGSVATSLDFIRLRSVATGNTVPIQGITYAGNIFQLTFNVTDLPKGEYDVEMQNLCNSCGFPFTLVNRIDIKFEGIAGMADSELKIWPVPANEKIFIENEKTASVMRFSLVDPLGEILFTDNIYPGKRYELNTGRYPGGIYILIFEPFDSKIKSYRKIIIE
ncbi:MAG TPA: hypothetical protein PLW31_01230 [Bacteroidales bacterium]|nr:hypothetical protein [Bacteroidales bacterium]HPI85358.1 hypothetical protein [Bacteroidales bacterium]HPM91301.1 hypothetical protein [Bacteroidales bacterium]